MLTKISSSLSFLLLTALHTVPTDFPLPPHTANTLFYIQRSSNTNTVMYELNIRADKTIDDKEPVLVYWLRFAQRGQRRSLNYVERTIAYGVHCEPTDRNTFTMRFNASKAKWAEVQLNPGGQAEAHMLIGDRMSKLKKIFVQVSETSWWPKVHYVEFFGTELETNEPTYEKMLI